MDDLARKVGAELGVDGTDAVAVVEAMSLRGWTVVSTTFRVTNRDQVVVDLMPRVGIYKNGERAQSGDWHTFRDPKDRDPGWFHRAVIKVAAKALGIEEG